MYDSSTGPEHGPPADHDDVHAGHDDVHAGHDDVHAGHDDVHAGHGHGQQGSPGPHTGHGGAQAESGRAHGGHGGAHAGSGGAHAGHHEAMFARPFWIALVLTVPILAYAEPIEGLLGYTAPRFPGSTWLVPILASVIYWYCGRVFLTGAVPEIRTRQPGMMTLVALAISTAYFYSLAVTFGLAQGMPFYWELSTLVAVMLLGHWMEMRAVGSAQSALQALAKLLPDTAERLVDGRTEVVPVDQLQPGDVLLVRPGMQVPSDGVVEDGRSQVNESMMTGESRPVDKRPGDEVIGGTVNGSGSLRIRVAQAGDQTVLAGIMRLVQEAQSSKTRAQALADRAAYWLTLIAVGVALAAAIGWTLVRGFDDFTLERVVTTLVVACPHALGLAIPLVIAISTTLSARNGILVRNRMALEQARSLDVVVFDKTGTLTRGEQGLVGSASVEGLDRREALALAAAVEGDSEHMIARAIREAADRENVTSPSVSQFEALPGRGAQATVDGRTLQVGGPRLLEQERVDLPADLAERTRTWGERGQTVVYLVEQGRVLAAFALADVIRPESRAAVEALRRGGVRVAMLTGDSEDVARWVATELGIDEYFAQVLPGQKSERVEALQAGDARVAMVGDGVNDAPALARADVGIAIGAGTDVARASADIVLIKNDPRDVARIITLSRATYRKMVQNLAWAVGYNAIALPLAAGVLAGVGFVLPAWVGGVLMSASTIVVAINAQTLRSLRL
ncbi:MAG: heavy metal translocating P-type ATPase [Chloroflexi bacterium]|nr:heavy metal translocating P-type ATPase [Chloroflexota bacterium]